jgi:hypothetical protein
MTNSLDSGPLACPRGASVRAGDHRHEEKENPDADDDDDLCLGAHGAPDWLLVVLRNLY